VSQKTASGTGSVHVSNIDAFFQSQRAGIQGDLVGHLTEFISTTRETLDCAIYDLRHPDVLQALARVAHSASRMTPASSARAGRARIPSQVGRRRLSRRPDWPISPRRSTPAAS